MRTEFYSRAAFAVAAGLAAVFFLAPAANAKPAATYFKASSGTVKKGCSGGTYLGTNKEGFYGCIAGDGKSVTTCKKGRCVKDPT